MTQAQTAAQAKQTSDVFLPPPHEIPHVRRQMDDLLAEVAEMIAPVWPLKDYVAVNPYAGLSDRPFLDARSFLQLFSDCETLMPLSYFAEQFGSGKFGVAEISAAIGELGLRATPEEQQAYADTIVETMQSTASRHSDLPNTHRVLRTMAEYAGDHGNVDWSETICDEISKFCAAHYDEGQAVWSSPWQDLPLFQAWRSAALIDRNIETIGLRRFRAFVSEMPHSADAAIMWLLQRLEVPYPLWKPLLLCEAFSLPGWSAWAKYQTSWTSEDRVAQNDLAGLIAIRLAYDVALSEAMTINVNWDSVCHNESASFQASDQGERDDSTARHVLLRASEIAYRNQLLGSLSIDEHQSVRPDRKQAQLVFCIDVRSERIRRNLEQQSSAIETFGFAGFFGMPVEFVPMGEESGTSHVPVLLKPQFQLHEGLHETESACEAAAIKKRKQLRLWRKLWKGFQTSAVGCFGFVESLGLLYGWKLLVQSPDSGNAKEAKFDGVAASDREHLGPTLRGLNQQGITTSHQADLAESMLRNLGLTDNFARLVTFCGHASQTENNPLAAGLDCGACGGHSGEPNARLAAMLLNQPYIREALATRGIEIPEDTYFLGALHNTTTDNIEFFDVSEIPQTHRSDFTELLAHTATAGEQTRAERVPIVASNSVPDLIRRAADWSELRPEWGLAGNAAFIVGPRSLSIDANLDARAFLHSYDYRSDPDGTVLESIMTAPMVVAHWINMQYFASTVDHQHFGSGDKTIHNVVGRFGVLSGNGGDLKTGLPWQSLHTGDSYQHLPMRLQAVISAPLHLIDQVIEKHQSIDDLLTNQWLHLVAIDQGSTYRYVDGSWEQLSDCQSPQPCTVEN